MLHPFRLSEDLRVDRRLHVPHASPNRKQRKAGLETRFKTLIENDIFKLATFLDPFFGLNAFEEKYQSEIKRKVEYYKKKLTMLRNLLDSIQQLNIICKSFYYM